MSLNVQINKRSKCFTREELISLSKEELIDKIVQLQAYNKQLKNILCKKMQENEQQASFAKVNEDIDDDSSCIEEAKKLTRKKFDFTKAHKRHVLLKFLYFGWDFHGYACQEDSNNTIEDHLFRALTRTCLIESRKTANYHRCGRTDKEVSAHCQVISIDLRSKYPVDQQFSEDSLRNEIDYCGLLNRVLPNNIQCIAWLPLRNSQFSARFDCITRTYRYFFPKGDLNITAMQEACKLLQRHADFRNFCKMDVHNGVTSYLRHIHSAEIHLCSHERDNNDKGYAMYYLEIKANAFLWHQIRCIMAILLLIGQEKEQPQIISELLDLEKNPCKPQYTPATGFPLNLFNCEFRKNEQFVQNVQAEVNMAEDSNRTNIGTKNVIDAEASQWLYSEEHLKKLIANVQSEWTKFHIKSSMIREVLHNLEELLSQKYKQHHITKQASLLESYSKAKKYQKLLNRKRCESLENRVEHFIKKQRLIIKTNNDE